MVYPGREQANAWQPTHLTHIPVLLGKHLTTLEYLYLWETSLEVKYLLFLVAYPAMSSTEEISHQRSNCLGPPETVTLVPAESSKIATAGGSNVLLARTHTDDAHTQH